MSDLLLDCRALGKRYGSRIVLDDFSLSCGPGALAITGANGAGKSTLISILAGVAAPDKGAVLIGGHDLAKEPVAARAQLGYVPDEPVAYPFMRGIEFLRFACALKGLGEDAIDAALIEGFGLSSMLELRFDTMSLGTQRKHMLVAGFLGAPAVVVMDEPSNGLDPAACAFLAATIVARRAKQLLLFSTHDSQLLAASTPSIVALKSPTMAAS